MKMARKKVAVVMVGRVRMLERPPRSDEGQLGQSIPQAVEAAAARCRENGEASRAY